MELAVILLSVTFLLGLLVRVFLTTPILHHQNDSKRGLIFFVAAQVKKNKSASFLLFALPTFIITLLPFKPAEALIDEIYWKIIEPIPSSGEPIKVYGSAAEACRTGIELKQKLRQQLAQEKVLEWRVPEPFYWGGSYIDINFGKYPGDAGFVNNAREIGCNHEYRCVSNCGGSLPREWSTNWPYSGATITLVGDICQNGKTWDTGLMGCIEPPPPQYCPTNGDSGNPVRTSIGSKVQVETDWSSPGLKFTRFYSSLADANSPLGPKWSHNYHARLLLVSGTLIEVQRPNNESYKYEWVADHWESNHDLAGTLSQEGTEWLYTGRDNVVERYDDRGWLIERVIGGNTETLQYKHASRLLESVTDARGEQLIFEYDSLSRLSKITLPNGGDIRYNYDAINNLTTVSMPDGTPENQNDNPERIYHYNEQDFTDNSQLPYHLTGITDERGVRYATYEYYRTNNTVPYYSDSRVKASYHAGNTNRIDITYGADGSRTVTNSRGQPSAYSSITQLGVPMITGISGPSCSTCGTGNTTYEYDPDNNNLLTKVEQDCSGQVILVTVFWPFQYCCSASIGVKKPGSEINFR